MECVPVAVRYKVATLAEDIVGPSHGVDIAYGNGEFEMGPAAGTDSECISIVEAGAQEFPLHPAVVLLEIVVAPCSVECQGVPFEPILGFAVASEPVAPLKGPSQKLEAILIGLVRPQPGVVVVCSDGPMVPDGKLCSEVQQREEEIGPEGKYRDRFWWRWGVHRGRADENMGVGLILRLAGLYDMLRLVQVHP